MADENAINYQGPSVSPKAGDDFGSAAGAKADEYLTRGKEACADVVHRVQSFRNDAERYVRQNPAGAVFTALAVGFVLGLFLRR